MCAASPNALASGFVLTRNVNSLLDASFQRMLPTPSMAIGSGEQPVAVECPRSANSTAERRSGRVPFGDVQPVSAAVVCEDTVLLLSFGEKSN